MRPPPQDAPAGCTAWTMQVMMPVEAVGAVVLRTLSCIALGFTSPRHAFCDSRRS